MTGITHVLNKAIPGVDGDMKEITFREPTAADIIRFGNPVQFDPISDPPRVSFDEKKMNAMMGALSNVPPPILEKMMPNDWVGIAWKLAPFFVPAMD